MDSDTLLNTWEQNNESGLYGRYIRLSDIEPLLLRGNRKGRIEIIGTSVLRRPVYSYRIGSGDTRILMWSQMHGNESTATKAIFDLLNLLDSKSDFAKSLLRRFEFLIIPMLNPDGAETYTRENANGVDLNRDFVNLSQPESVALHNILKGFNPGLCLNLHDQRTIFGVGDTARPATISLLAPAFDSDRNFNDCRMRAVAAIIKGNDLLQKIIPGQVGRFDDGFNINCVGDKFMNAGFPTVLIEAGHFANDYQREVVRKLFFITIVSIVSNFYENDIVDRLIDDYMHIPQNKASFYDIVYRNVKIYYDGIEKNTNFALQYREELTDAVIHFQAYFAEIGTLDGFFGHTEIDVKGAVYSGETQDVPSVGHKADFMLDGNLRVLNGVITSTNSRSL